MTISLTSKIRAITGTSTFAIATGFVGAAQAFAAAPPPEYSVPTPAAPAAPANVEECALDVNATPPEIICAPGTDPDGLSEPFNSISATVQAGSQVQGEINLLVGADVTIDGDFVSTTGRAIDVGAASTVVNNGFITNTVTPFSGIIRTGDGSTIINNGVISSAQSNQGGIESNSNSIVTNTGDIFLTGFGTIGITGTGSVSAFGSDTGVTVNNTMTGRIIVGPAIAGVFLGDDATVNNEGLIQTFGDNAVGVIVGDDSTVTNGGTVFTTGDQASGIQAGNNSTVINTGSGRVFTFGDNLASVLVGTNSSVQNNGLITTRGDSAISIVAGDGSTVQNNPTGQIATTGVNSHAIVITGDGTVNNIGGLIQTTGLDAQAIIINGDATVLNSGIISTSNSRAVDLGGTATVTNLAGGVIGAANGDAIRFNGAGSVLDNAGRVSANGDGALAVNALNDITLTNSGLISTTGMNTATVLGGVGSTIVNTGMITSSGNTALGVAVRSGSTIDNSGTISTIGVNSGAVLFTEDGTLVNSGTISTLRTGAVTVVALDTLALTNTGTIESTSSRAIDIDNGSVINAGGATISAATEAVLARGDVFIRNEGTITGDTGISGVTGVQTVFNFGTITGMTAAASLGDGDDTFVSINGGSESGTVDGGDGTDVYAFIVTDGTDRDFNLDALDTGYLNFESLRFGSQTFDFVNLTTNTAPATGIVNLTGSTSSDIQVINTAILSGTVNGNVALLQGANTGIVPAFQINTGGGINNGAGDALTITQDGWTVTNSGLINSATGFGINAAGTMTTVINTGAGTISTSGNNTAAVLVGDNSFVQNNGLIITQGDSAIGVVAGDGSTVANNPTGQIGTTGTNAHGIVITGDGTLINAGGLIQTSGADAAGVIITGAATIDNSGTINSLAGRGIDVADASTITNRTSGIISGNGGDAIRFNAAGSTLTNDGTVSASGTGNFGLNAQVSNTTLTNRGTITTSGTNSAAAYVGVGSTVDNSGTISTTADSAVALAADDGSMISNTGSITTIGDNSGAVVFISNGMLVNDGTISTLGTNAQGVTAIGQVMLVNNGTIDATTARAVDVGGGMIVNNVGGVISGGTEAIRLAGAGTIRNQGTISGDSGISGSNDQQIIFNFGAINGTTSAVSLADGDDFFVKINDATETGTVDGSTGNDTFAFITTDGTDRSFDLGLIGSQYVGFDSLRFGSQTFDFVNLTANAPVATGVLTLTGQVSQDISIINTAILDGLVNGTVTLEQGANAGIAPVFTVTGNGSIAAAGDGVVATQSGWTVNNGGSITSTGGIGVNANVDSIVVNNSGSIDTTGSNTASVLVGTNGVINNTGSILATGNSGVAIAAGSGTMITNAAGSTITTRGDNGFNIVINGDGMVANDGIISSTGTGAQVITITGNGVVTNTGIIAASDERAIDIGGPGAVVNEASGIIASGNSDAIRFNGDGSTLTNRGTVIGETGVQGNIGSDTVVNFGSITGNTAAASLGDGDDVFQQWTGATVTGDVDLGGGSDTFVLEGSASSVAGTVDGGADADLLILAGILDADNFANFETVQLGSTLGGTLNDLTISGNRTITGDIVHVGEVFVDLGVDSLTTTGTITLESTGVLNIDTPLDAALAGQTVTVFAGSGITNNGATVNINDDDLLVDYALLLNNGVQVQVNFVNPLFGNPDANLDAFGNAVLGGLTAGTISAANFAALNGLDATQFQTAAQDALPSLSDGLGREIFETASFAGQMLDRHLATEGSAIWGQVAVRGAEQDALSASADGYDSDQLIFTVGADFAASNGIRVGVLASYADIDNQDLRGDTVPTEMTEAESIKLGVYTGISLGDRGFLNGELAYITGEADTARGGFFGTTTSEFGFDGFIGRATLGYDLLPDENVSITPSIGVNFARINFDDAAETGGFGFTVERGDAEFAELRGGLEVGATLSNAVSGFISGTIIRDLEDSTRSFRLSSTQLPTFNAVLPQRDQDRFELAAGVSINASETFAIDLGYLGDFSDGYQGHSARVTARIGF